MVTIAHISDTHQEYGWDSDLIDHPADILIHSGDFSNFGTMQELVDFNSWLGEQDYPHIINIAGNHDSICARLEYDVTKNLFTNSIYLQDNMVEVKGLKIYGTPWCNKFGNWSFMDYEQVLDEYWAKIPVGIDVLVVHGPPKGILDRVPRGGGLNVGSVTLRQHILNRIRPKAVLFGHIHCSSGQLEYDGIKFSNGAILNDYHDITNKPRIITL